MEEEKSRKLRQSRDLNYINGISLPASKANGASLHSFLSFFFLQRSSKIAVAYDISSRAAPC